MLSLASMQPRDRTAIAHNLPHAVGARTSLAYAKGPRRREPPGPDPRRHPHRPTRRRAGHWTRPKADTASISE